MKVKFCHKIVVTVGNFLCVTTVIKIKNILTNKVQFFYLLGNVYKINTELISKKIFKKIQVLFMASKMTLHHTINKYLHYSDIFYRVKKKIKHKNQLNRYKNLNLLRR